MGLITGLYALGVLPLRMGEGVRLSLPDPSLVAESFHRTGLTAALSWLPLVVVVWGPCGLALRLDSGDGSFVELVVSGGAEEFCSLLSSG